MRIKAAALSLLFGVAHFACVVRVVSVELDCKEHCGTGLVVIGRVLAFPLLYFYGLYRQSHPGSEIQLIIAIAIANSLVWAIAMWIALTWFTARSRRTAVL